MRTTVAYQQLRVLTRRYADSALERYFIYVSRFVERWARSYAQYITIKSGEPTLLADLDDRRMRQTGQIYIPLQWDDTDFALIAKEIDAVFRAKGWIA